MKRFLTSLAVNVCRTVLGLVFTASGLSKAVDPAGMEHKVSAYLDNWGVLTWTAGTAWLTVAVIALALAEFMLGIALLLGAWRKTVTRLVALATLAFTALTVYIYAREPVADCGCFGEALRLSNGETLAKNVVLCLLCLPPLLRPLAVTPLARRGARGLALLYAAAFLVAVAVRSSVYMPVADFTSYVPGYNFERAMAGELGDKAMEDAFNFAVIDTAGNDVTFDLLADTGYTFVAVIPRLERADRGVSDRIAQLHRQSLRGGFGFAALTSSATEARRVWADATGAEYAFCHTDEGVLEAAARTSPGLLLLHGGTIVGKWGRIGLAQLLTDADGNVSPPKLAQPPYNLGQRLLKIAAWLFIPLIFLIFADKLAAGAVKLRRVSLRRIARSRMAGLGKEEQET
ncbi:MAG: DoxX family protein [Bacteroidaceae bacterium]|nr:DoxX family protein [Bacteroidaceae bacterium]